MRIKGSRYPKGSFDFLGEFFKDKDIRMLCCRFDLFDCSAGIMWSSGLLGFHLVSLYHHCNLFDVPVTLDSRLSESLESVT